MVQSIGSIKNDKGLTAEVAIETFDNAAKQAALRGGNLSVVVELEQLSPDAPDQKSKCNCSSNPFGELRQHDQQREPHQGCSERGKQKRTLANCKKRRTD